MRDQGLEHLLAQELARRHELHRARSRRVVLALDSTHLQIGQRRLTNFASNNYLGLTHHRRVVAAAQRAAQSSGVGSGASALICGYSDAHQAAELAIANWKQTEAAVLLPSGYQAAHASIQTLASIGEAQPAGVRFLIDKLCHASFIDAVRGSAMPFRIFPHNHLEKLKRLLAEAPPDQMQVVVTESIFSMDGDAADLSGLASLKAEHPFVLVLDEAHGSGAYGHAGSGYADECGLQNIVDVSLVTLSKAVGVAGGAICASRLFCDAVVNWGRAYIYSTSVPPMSAAAIIAAIQVMQDEPQRQQRLRMLARHVRAELAKGGFALALHDSPIIPVVLGSESRALDAAERLWMAGLLVPAIRPPTVPLGSSRLRITLCCDHSDAEVDQLISHLRTLPAR